jgi:hypothetical protein
MAVNRHRKPEAVFRSCCILHFAIVILNAHLAGYRGILWGLIESVAPVDTLSDWNFVREKKTIIPYSCRT